MPEQLTPQKAASETRNKIKRAAKREQAKYETDHVAYIALQVIIDFIDKQARRADAKEGGLGKKKKHA